jgi:hypothetical protein
LFAPDEDLERPFATTLAAALAQPGPSRRGLVAAQPSLEVRAHYQAEAWASAAWSPQDWPAAQSPAPLFPPTQQQALAPSAALPAPAHGSAAHEGPETPVRGNAASKARAVAVKCVGSGTAGAVTTDFTKTGYEVTVSKSDGSQVETMGTRTASAWR